MIKDVNTAIKSLKTKECCINMICEYCTAHNDCPLEILINVATPIESPTIYNLKKFNINEYVRVKLNEVGLEIYKNRMKEINKNLEETTELKFPIYPIYPIRDNKGYVKFQLWDLMEIFGSYLRVGKEIPFEDNSIYIESNDLREVE